MKKNMLICILTSAMICGNFASCGENKDSDVAPKVETTTAVTTTETVGEQAETTTSEEKTTAESTATAAPENTESTPEAPVTEAPNSSADTSAYLTDAASVLNNLNTVDSISGGAGIEVDASVTQTEGSNTYSKVTDSRFSSLNDVKNYVNDKICGSLLSRYAVLYEGENAYFKESGGELYFIQTGRGSGFSFTGDPIITDAADDSFTVTIKFDNFGGDSTLEVKAVKDNGKWKASSFKVDDLPENSR